MGIIETIMSAAQANGVDPTLAVATAWQESRLNPQAVGDQGQSFGLYQLHRGGELGNHDAAWAFNPVNNADTALSVMGQVARAHPTWSPGQIAAAAQRPGDPTGYAASINSLVQQIRSGALRLPDPPDNATGPTTAIDDPRIGQRGDGSGAPPPLADVFPFNLINAGVDAATITQKVIQAVGYVVGRVGAWITMPHFGMRLFAGFVGTGFLAAGVIMFVMG